MSIKILGAFMVTGSIVSMPVVSNAQAGGIDPIVSMCRQNPNCSHEPQNEIGGVLFKIKTQGYVRKVLCNTDGNCIMLLPRGKKYGISDVSTIIAAKGD